MSATRTLRQTLIVCRKELRDSLRDRRALWSILFSVVIGPVLVGFMMNKLADRQRDADIVRIPVVGMDRAPALVNWLNQQGGVQVVEGPAEAEKAVREQREAVVVIVPDDFAERFRSSRPAPLQLVADSSRNDAGPSVQRVQLLLQQYAAEISSLRLIMRGVSPAAMRPLAIEEIEVSTAQQRAAQILTFIPMFIMVAGFVGGMQIATDSTAGERERGSLEPLLVNPAPRVAFVAGKWLAATLAAIVSVCLTTVLCAQITRLLSLEDMGIRLEIGLQHVGPILLAVGPMCLFTAALQAAVATLARSFKEAQTYMGVLILGPMLPGILSALYPIGKAAWSYAIPMLGPYVLLTDVLGGRAPNSTAFLMSAGTCLLASAILIRITTGLFRSEHIILGR
ncbi:MAG TPA: ABC transporter permease [Vicinamibacterales bacterium]|nr:ABC transporter permease [Vicinamibacterales bacterium]